MLLFSRIFEHQSYLRLALVRLVRHVVLGRIETFHLLTVELRRRLKVLQHILNLLPLLHLVLVGQQLGGSLGLLSRDTVPHRVYLRAHLLIVHVQETVVRRLLSHIHFQPGCPVLILEKTAEAIRS